jgi:hypothetical protein
MTVLLGLGIFIVGVLVGMGLMAALALAGRADDAEWRLEATHD